MTLRVIGQGGIFVVNQNHHPGWTASLGEVIAWQGLLAVRVPPGEHEVRLSFRPPLFLFGAGLTLVSVVAVACVGVQSRRS